MDWFYAEKAHETVCICDWVFGWGVVISFVEGASLWEKWDPISARNEGGATLCKGNPAEKGYTSIKGVFLE